jgi:hypothetical protein
METQCVHCEVGAVIIIIIIIIGATSKRFGIIFRLVTFSRAGFSIFPLVELLFLYQLGYHIF